MKENSIGYWHNEVVGTYYPEGRKIEQNSVVDHKAIRHDVISILNQKDPSRFVVKEMEALGAESDLRIADNVKYNPKLSLTILILSLVTLILIFVVG